MPHVDLYSDRDPRETPAYGLTEAARYLRIPPSTLREWFVTGNGRHGFDPLITPADPGLAHLSFSNLVEAYVLRALRAVHRVGLPEIRNALKYAKGELKIDRPLLTDLYTASGEVFLEHFEHLINLSRSGQLAMRKILESILERVERDDHRIPLRLYPVLNRDYEGGRTVVIDPSIAFGRPTIAGKGISTSILASRVDAGESLVDLERDYDLSRREIEDAIVFENAA